MLELEVQCGAVVIKGMKRLSRVIKLHAPCLWGRFDLADVIIEKLVQSYKGAPGVGMIQLMFSVSSDLSDWKAMPTHSPAACVRKRLTNGCGVLRRTEGLSSCASDASELSVPLPAHAAHLSG